LEKSAHKGTARFVQATNYLSREARGRLSLRSQVLFTAIVLGVLYATDILADFMFDQVGVDLVLPTSMWYLSESDWWAFAATSLASAIAYILTIAVAFWLAMFAAIFATSERWQVRLIGISAAQMYNFFFVVPVVLTASMVLTILLRKNMDGLPGPYVVLGSVVFAAFCIAGFPVFSTVFKGAVNPDKRHALLVGALYNPARGAGIGLSERISNLKRLNDGQIRNFSDSVERAWPLAIVSVVIIESISPGIYGYLYDDFPVLRDHVTGGVGRKAVEAQHSLDVRRVWGFMWALFLLDLAGMVVIDRILNRRYLRHYKGGG